MRKCSLDRNVFSLTGSPVWCGPKEASFTAHRVRFTSGRHGDTSTAPSSLLLFKKSDFIIIWFSQYSQCTNGTHNICLTISASPKSNIKSGNSISHINSHLRPWEGWTLCVCVSVCGGGASGPVAKETEKYRALQSSEASWFTCAVRCVALRPAALLNNSSQ